MGDQAGTEQHRWADRVRQLSFLLLACSARVVVEARGGLGADSEEGRAEAREAAKTWTRADVVGRVGEARAASVRAHVRPEETLARVLEDAPKVHRLQQGARGRRRRHAEGAESDQGDQGKGGEVDAAAARHRFSSLFWGVSACEESPADARVSPC